MQYPSAHQLQLRALHTCVQLYKERGERREKDKEGGGRRGKGEKEGGGERRGRGRKIVLLVLWW